MRYTTAYVVKVATDSLVLSFVLTRYIVVLLYMVQVASRGEAITGSSAGRVAVMTVVGGLFAFAVGRYTIYVRPIC